MITALIPVLSRPQNVRPLIESFLAHSREDSRLVFIAQGGDSEEINTINEATGPKLRRLDAHQVWMIEIDSYATRWSAKLNAAHRAICTLFWSSDLTVKPDWYLLGADDLRFHKGWDDNPALEVLMARPEIGVIGTNDMGNPAVMAGKHSTHPLIRRTYVETQGIMEGLNMIAPECYNHNFVDNEIVGLACKRKAYAHCHDSKIEHMHPVWNKGEMDSTYKLGISKYRDDQKLYQVREMMYGFPSMGER